MITKKANEMINKYIENYDKEVMEGTTINVRSGLSKLDELKLSIDGELSKNYTQEINKYEGDKGTLEVDLRIIDEDGKYKVEVAVYKASEGNLKEAIYKRAKQYEFKRYIGSSRMENKAEDYIHALTNVEMVVDRGLGLNKVEKYEKGINDGIKALKERLSKKYGEYGRSSDKWGILSYKGTYKIEYTEEGIVLKVNRYKGYNLTVKNYGLITEAKELREENIEKEIALSIKRMEEDFKGYIESKIGYELRIKNEGTPKFKYDYVSGDESEYKTIEVLKDKTVIYRVESEDIDSIVKGEGYEKLLKESVTNLKGELSISNSLLKGLSKVEKDYAIVTIVNGLTKLGDTSLYSEGNVGVIKVNEKESKIEGARLYEIDIKGSYDGCVSYGIEKEVYIDSNGEKIPKGLVRVAKAKGYKADW